MHPFFATIVAATALSSAVFAGSHRTLPFPFEVTSAGSDVVELRLDAEAVAPFSAAFADHTPVRVRDVPLPGLAADLLLRPVRAFAPGARAVVVGEGGEVLDTIAPRVATFSGHVRGETSEAFLAVSPTAVHGFVKRAGETYWISSGPATSAPVRTATIARGSTMPSSPVADWCASTFDGATPALVSAGAAEGGDPTVRTADLAFEVMPNVLGLFSGPPETLDYVTTLISLCHVVYRRDLGVELSVPGSYVRIWTVAPPYSDLFGFANWYQSDDNSNKDLERAAVMLLSAGPPFGIALSLETLCIDSISYAVTSIKGFFPTPLQHTDIDNHDPFIVSHEFGHLWGSPHTFDYFPAIPCNDDTGPDQGTIMSYCEFEIGGIDKVGMRFHETVQEHIRGYLASDSPACMPEVSYQMGDYDRSGVVDAVDLAAFESLAAQGFVSHGALDAFDFDGNEVLDGCDLAALSAAAGISVAAEVTRPGPNPVVFNAGVTSAPVTGAVWDPQVDHTSFVPAAIADFVAISAAPTELDLGSTGTLLCDAPYLAVLLNETPGAPFAIPIPDACPFVGLDLCAQAGSSADGVQFQLTNALDFTIGGF